MTLVVDKSNNYNKVAFDLTINIILDMCFYSVFI